MPISDVAEKGPWIIVFDDKGKEISRMGASQKRIVGITGGFFVVDEGGVWIVTYDERCKSISRMGGRIKTVRGAAGDTFTVEEGPWLITYDRNCKERARRGAGSVSSRKSQSEPSETIVETGRKATEDSMGGCGALIAFIVMGIFGVMSDYFTTSKSIFILILVVVVGIIFVYLCFLRKRNGANNKDEESMSFVSKIAIFGKAALRETRRRSYMVALKAKIEKLKLLDLNTAKYALGRKAYELRIAAEKFAGEYDEIAAIEKTIGVKRSGVPGDHSATNLELAKRAAMSVKMSAEAQGLELKLKQMFVALGSGVELLSEAAGLESEMTAVHSIHSHVEKLDQEYSTLSEKHTP